MRMNLRRVREIQNLTLKELAKRCNMSKERLRAIEQYKILPEIYEVIRILKKTNYYFDDTCAIIWHDIDDHYIPKSRGEYQQLLSSVEIADLYTTTEELERFAIPEDNSSLKDSTISNSKKHDPALNNEHDYLIESVLESMPEYFSTTDRKE